MSELVNEVCIACNADSSRISAVDCDKYMGVLERWTIEETGGLEKLFRQYKFSNFCMALDFTNKIGSLAEKEDHHPVLVTQWGSVEVFWWTHVVHGLHQNDFVMAARCDQIYDEKNDLRT